MINKPFERRDIDLQAIVLLLNKSNG